MRAALIILSTLTILIGIYAGPGSEVIQVPPEGHILEAHRELGKVPLPEADADRLRRLLDQGVGRSRGERERLSGHLNSVCVLSFAVGAAGLLFGIFGGRRSGDPAGGAGVDDGRLQGTS